MGHTTKCTEKHKFGSFLVECSGYRTEVPLFGEVYSVCDTCRDHKIWNGKEWKALSGSDELISSLSQIVNIERLAMCQSFCFPDLTFVLV